MWCETQIVQKMEEFSQHTDDFLSSGFHQFYTEFNNVDTFIWEDDLQYCMPDCTTANIINCEYVYDNNQELYIEDTRIEVNSSEQSDDNLFENTGFDKHLETLLLDTSFIGDNWMKPINLPEKTLLCNDSCDLFLKESSENLKMPSPSPTQPTNSEEQCKNTDADEKVYPCTYGTCQKMYAKPAHLKAHMRRHLGDKPYICTWDNCTWRFSRSDELARHRRSHSGIKPYKCCYCPKSFARSDHLAKHRKVHERKMAISKIKELWTNVTPGRPGRKPNLNKIKVN